ncbi:hypothetical protein [Spectribacter hydrogenoxidans]|uniref:Uncharacterized protein n=1 Tax=Spectribacter hydrogenoxidans TaxID=3075608 RepID=A0ABU3C449_9GAMM|nr:hypothetical protein [Salinisphaera sp. W335]MDT0636347.1 hypothetical protein [Salinisphaera sp. W335]
MARKADYKLYPEKVGEAPDNIIISKTIEYGHPILLFFALIFTLLGFFSIHAALTLSLTTHYVKLGISLSAIVCFISTIWALCRISNGDDLIYHKIIDISIYPVASFFVSMLLYMIFVLPWLKPDYL